MVDDFFTLRVPYNDIGKKEFLGRLTDRSCSNMLYRPSTLNSQFSPRAHRVQSVTFSNVSFAHTVVNNFEFTNCYFYDCLFIDTIFKNCRFTACKFVRCNAHRIEFKECYVNPHDFVECIPEHRYANIGVYLFQELLRNSRQQVQRDFADQAQFHFYKWRRYQLRQDIRSIERRRDKCLPWVKVAMMFALELSTGSGTRLGRLACSSVTYLFMVSLINLMFAGPFGLDQDKQQIQSFVQGLYFSTILTTTVGFGDIVPKTPEGQLAICLEAVFGFINFAMLTSSLFRRFSA